MMMKGFFTAALAALAVSAAVLALAGCSDGGGNKASPVSGTVDMTRMTADESLSEWASVFSQIAFQFGLNEWLSAAIVWILPPYIFLLFGKKEVHTD